MYRGWAFGFCHSGKKNTGGMVGASNRHADCAGKGGGHRLVEDGKAAFERLIDFLAQMVELYGPEVLQEIEGMEKSREDSGT